jgi:hypothetical protein
MLGQLPKLRIIPDRSHRRWGNDDDLVNDAIEVEHLGGIDHLLGLPGSHLIKEPKGGHLDQFLDTLDLVRPWGEAAVL